MMFSQIKTLKSGEWSESEKKHLKDHYPFQTAKSIADYLRRSEHSVNSMVYVMIGRGELESKK